MKLVTSVKVDFDDVQGMVNEVKRLQTYKLFEGDDMVLVDLDAVVAIMANHVKADKCSEIPNSSDTISRQAAIDVLIERDPNCGIDSAEVIKEVPSAQPERLTDDDFEVIRTHLNAWKEKLCNQHRWEEAEEYQRIVDRFKAFASAQTERNKGEWIVTSEFEDCRYARCNQCKVTQIFYYNKPLTNFCPNCGADMRQEGEKS